MEEIWEVIKDFPKYEVSTLGRVRNCKTGRVLKAGISSGTGYLVCGLCVDGKATTKAVHRLVAETFIPNMDNKNQVNHKDGNKLNNNVNNLEWCTSKHNLRHARDTGLNNNSGEQHFLSKLTKEQVDFIREKYIPRDKEYSGVALARKFGVSQQTISDIINNKNWK